LLWKRILVITSQNILFSDDYQPNIITIQIATWNKRENTHKINVVMYFLIFMRLKLGHVILCSFDGNFLQNFLSNPWISVEPEVTLRLFVCKIQPAVYIRIANPSRGGGTTGVGK